MERMRVLTAAVAACMTLVAASLVLGPLGLTTLVRFRRQGWLYELLYGFDDAVGIKGKTLATIVWRIVMVFAGAAAAGVASVLLVLRDESSQRILLKKKHTGQSAEQRKEGGREMTADSGWRRRVLAAAVLRALAQLWVILLPFACGAMVALSWARRHGSLSDWWNVWSSIALGLGFAGVISVMIFLMPLARMSSLKERLGIDFAGGIAIHRLLGHLALACLVAHGAGFIIKWAWEGRLAEELLRWQPYGICMPAGAIALTFGVVLWISSTPWIRRQRFRLFYRTHILMAFGFFIFASMHYPGFFYYIAPGLLLLCIDVAGRSRMFMRPKVAMAAVVKDPGASAGVGRLVRLDLPKFSCGAKPMEFAFVNIPEISKVEWHPLSLLSYGRASRMYLRVTDNQRGFTSRLRALILERQRLQSGRDRTLDAFTEMHARSCGPPGDGVKLQVKLQGPCAPTPFEVPASVERIVMIAGGTGIVPILSYVNWLSTAPSGLDGPLRTRLRDGVVRVRLVWCVRSEGDVGILMQLAKGPLPFRLSIDIHCTDDSSIRGVEAAVAAFLRTCDSSWCTTPDMGLPVSSPAAPVAHAKAMILEHLLYIFLITAGTLSAVILAERFAGGDFMMSWLQGLTLTLSAVAGALIAMVVGASALEWFIAKREAKGARIARSLASCACDSTLPCTCDAKGGAISGVPTKAADACSCGTSVPCSCEAHKGLDLESCGLVMRRDELAAPPQEPPCDCIEVRTHRGRPHIDSILCEADRDKNLGGTALCLASGPQSLVDAAQRACRVRNGGNVLRQNAVCFHALSFEL